MSRVSALQRALIERIAASGAEVALAARRIDDGSECLIASQEVFHAASTMKVAVMVEAYRRIAAGTLTLSARLPVANQFASIVDGSPYSLTQEHDEERSLYDAADASVQELLRQMIQTSSNLATNILIELLGAASVQEMLNQHGIRGLQVRRGMEDLLAFEQGLNNTTTAYALLQLFEGLAREIFPGSPAMIEILLGQQFRDGIPAGLPYGVQVAHKTGQITAHHHDAGIVYAPRPFVLVVLTRGLAEQAQSAALIADLARMVYAELGDDAVA